MAFSIVIPSRNMRADLEVLLLSIESSGLAQSAAEIIVIDDGSTDGTTDFLRARSSQWNTLKVISLNPGQGRFIARMKGAQAASSENIFFVDTRVQFPAAFAANFKNLMATHRELMGVPYIPTDRSIYNLHWDRTHKVFFRQHFNDAKTGFFLTEENFEDYTKGTGALLLRKEKFLELCQNISEQDAKFSDDTFILRNYVREFPIYVSDQCTFIWEPRQTLTGFISRLYERGQNFGYNHWLSGHTRFTVLSIIALLVAPALLIGLFALTASVVLAVIGVIFSMGVSIIFFTRSPLEIIKLAPLQVMSLISFGLGAISVLFKKRVSEQP